MEDFAGWIAPAATMIAAMMTAANLGARVTGWGFVVFTLGSIAWSVVAVATDQANLLWANGFLTVVNLVGIYRWLGREATLDDGQAVAQETSADVAGPALFPIAMLQGAAVVDGAGKEIGQSVGGMAECGGGIAYVVVRIGATAGVGGSLRGLRWDEVVVSEERLVTRVALDRRPEIDPADWPAEAPDGQ